MTLTVCIELFCVCVGGCVGGSLIWSLCNLEKCIINPRFVSNLSPQLGQTTHSWHVHDWGCKFCSHGANLTSPIFRTPPPEPIFWEFWPLDAAFCFAGEPLGFCPFLCVHLLGPDWLLKMDAPRFDGPADCFSSLILSKHIGYNFVLYMAHVTWVLFLTEKMEWGQGSWFCHFGKVIQDFTTGWGYSIIGWVRPWCRSCCCWWKTIWLLKWTIMYGPYSMDHESTWLTLACRVDCNGATFSGSEESFCPLGGVGGLFWHVGRCCFNSVILRKRFKQPLGHSVYT